MISNSIDFFKNINSYPQKITVPSSICRMVDGVGFRYYWATNNLNEKTYLFKPGENRWTVRDTISHIWDTSNWIISSLANEEYEKPDNSVSLRDSVLQILYKIRSFFAVLNDNDLEEISISKAPFWNLINGPIEDIISHVGAIDNMRRTAGDAPIEPRFFYGTPPEK